MSHFYGTLRGSRGQATRQGTRVSGVETVAASWKGCIRVRMFERDGEDCFTVSQEQWHGSGVYEILAEGVIGQPKNESPDPTVCADCLGAQIGQELSFLAYAGLRCTCGCWHYDFTAFCTQCEP